MTLTVLIEQDSFQAGYGNNILCFQLFRKNQKGVDGRQERGAAPQAANDAARAPSHKQGKLAMVLHSPSQRREEFRFVRGGQG